MLKTLINKIVIRPSYQTHTVLDADKKIVLVLANNIFYLYKDNKWSELTDSKAKKVLDNYYFSYRYNEMKEI